MTVLVTRADAPLGRALLSALRALGLEATGVAEAPSPAPLDAPPRLDLAQEAATEALSGMLGPGSVVVHLPSTAPAAGGELAAALRASVDLDVLGTLRVLDAARAAGASRVVLPDRAATAESEDEGPLRAVTWRAAVDHARALAEESDVVVVVVELEPGATLAARLAAACVPPRT